MSWSTAPAVVSAATGWLTGSSTTVAPPSDAASRCPNDPDVRDRLIDVYVEAEIVRLLNLRNYWMRHSGANITYEGPQASYMRKTSGLRMAQAMLDILGPAGLTHDKELGASEGHMEAHSRAGIVAIHPGGTTDIQKVIMARRIGIGREVRERAGALG